jgi:hypothetical protein
LIQGSARSAFAEPSRARRIFFSIVASVVMEMGEQRQCHRPESRTGAEIEGAGATKRHFPAPSREMTRFLFAKASQGSGNELASPAEDGTE